MKLPIIAHKTFLAILGCACLTAPRSLAQTNSLNEANGLYTNSVSRHEAKGLGIILGKWLHGETKYTIEYLPKTEQLRFISNMQRALAPLEAALEELHTQQGYPPRKRFHTETISCYRENINAWTNAFKKFHEWSDVASKESTTDFRKLISQVTGRRGIEFLFFVDTEAVPYLEIKTDPGLGGRLRKESVDAFEIFLTNFERLAEEASKGETRLAEQEQKLKSEAERVDRLFK